MTATKGNYLKGAVDMPTKEPRNFDLNIEKILEGGGSTQFGR
jgi:hypothetical protein